MSKAERQPMMTLEERILWVLDHRDMSAREWCLRAKMSGGYLGAVLTRLRDRTDAAKAEGRTLTAEEELGRISSDVIRKLAYVAEVSEDWLSQGIGAPETKSQLPLGKQSGWSEALAKAKAIRPRDLPERYLEEAATASYPTRPLSPELIISAANTLFITAPRPPPKDDD